MRTLPAGMQTHLDTGATTLCWCWKVTRADATVQGFTDHDNDVAFDSVTYAASTGFTATEIKDSTGLNVDNLDVEGALDSSSLNEDDLAAGEYDNATVEIFRVNWQDTSQRLLMRKGSIGQVRRLENKFIAEIRGLAHELNQKQGRVYQKACDADLGDSRCGVNLASATFKGSGTIDVAESTYRFTATGLTAYTSGWFVGGKLTWTSGNNNGYSMEVKYHTYDGVTVTLELWENPAFALGSSDTFDITAGCDKLFDTCKTKFSNTVNFRGFPHIPGNRYVLRYPHSSDPDNDGGSMND